MSAARCTTNTIGLAFVSLMFIIVRLSLGLVLYITHLCTAAHFCADVWELLRVESKFEPLQRES